MNSKQIPGKSNDRLLKGIVNGDTVAILAGAPVFLLGGATSDGALVLAGPNAPDIKNFAGYAATDIPVGGNGFSIIHGQATIRVPAAETGVVGASLLPTAAGANVYSSTAGTITAFTPKVYLQKTLATAATESNRAVVYIRSL